MNKRRLALLVPIVLLLCTGCVTQMQQRPADERSQRAKSGESALDGDSTRAEPLTAANGNVPFRDLSRNELLTFLRELQPEGYGLIPEMEAAVVLATSPDGDQELLLALLQREDSFALYEHLSPPGGGSAGGSQETGRLTPLAQGVTITGAGPLQVAAATSRPNGMLIQVRLNDREEELLVVAAATGSYVIRTPLSTAGRTVLRDLTGDGVAELVQYTRVFEAGGKREVIVDAFTWDGSGFVHDRSIALLRSVNTRLNRLAEQLRGGAATTDNTAWNLALEPQDGAAQASTVGPLREVRVPELSELLLDLGDPQWTVNHEIALIDQRGETQVYRLILRIIPDPYRATPVEIVGID